jgi:hypothetical protein
MAYPYGYSTFCDDIRQETGGKVSFIGCYRHKMFVHGGFPATLPKFGISFTFIERANKRPDHLIVMVFLPGDAEDKPSISTTVNVKERDKDPARPPVGERDRETVFRFESQLIFAPLILRSEGAIKVRFKVNDEIIKAGALSIEPFVGTSELSAEPPNEPAST